MSIEAFLAQQIIGITEAIDDRIAALLTEGIGIDLTYNDGEGTLTIESNGELGSTGRFFSREDATTRPEDGGYTDNVLKIGFNPGKVLGSEPSIHLTFEDKYLLNNSTPYVMECHIEGQHLDGSSFRLLSFAVPRNQADYETGSSMSMRNRKVAIEDWDGTVKCQMNWASNTVEWFSAQTHRFHANGGAFQQQRNAADTAFLNLPYIDSSNQLKISTPVSLDGSINSDIYTTGNIFNTNTSTGLQITSGKEILIQSASSRAINLKSNTGGSGNLGCDGFNRWTFTQESAGRVPVTIQQQSGSFANFQEMKNSAGTVVFSVGSAGDVTTQGKIIQTNPVTPASATASGTTGTMVWDADYIYVCTSTNSWKRIAISNW